MPHPSPKDARTHLARWRTEVGRDFVAADPHLRSLLDHYSRTHTLDALERFGRQCATTIDPLARENNRDENLPTLRPFDRFGNRTEEVVFHPSYHEIGRLVYRTRAMSLYETPGKEFESLCFQYLLSHNGEAGHACPLACTAGMIKILQQASDVPEEWLHRLLDPEYDTHFHASQFLTEIQGGSDVGANTTVARPQQDGTWELTGEKWFCSVIDADLFLVSARPEGGATGTRGVNAFVVPRRLPDGSLNAFTIRRLKYKLGTRSMASAETDFHGARAWLAGDFHQVVETVLNTSRLYNAVCSCGMMQRAWLEAHTYGQVRQAFGQPIAAFPSVARIIARLRTEAYAARSSTFALADLADRCALSTASSVELRAWRMLVNLNKYWTSAAATTALRDAIEILGGNGAIEEFTVLPRLLRDAIVCEAWEGGHNVLCAQVLRDCHRFQCHEAVFGWLEDRGAPAEPLLEARHSWATLLNEPEERAALHIRDLVDRLRPLVQGTCLLSEAQTADSDPLIPVVAEHLLRTKAPGWDPLQDTTFSDRIATLVLP